MITVSKEDYLKAVMEAESEGENVISATLAHRLSVSAPAVTMALRRLKRDGMVGVRANGQVELTRAGRAVALRTMVRHHLIERMLTEVFGMEWYRVHEEAERLEHAVSPEFEAKLARKLGPAGTCPHGNPVVPESGEARRRRGMRLLAEAQAGKSYRVTSVYERDGSLLRFLHERGIQPGVRVEVLERNYDQTLTVLAGKGKISVGGPAAEKVWVAPAKAVRASKR
ncbi:MAG TPA: metal-dependent transcriptional regulator [Terriglobales bacterium]|nr:metal-dependent transcriptional regulator [Terriglobales bacterium]